MQAFQALVLKSNGSELQVIFTAVNTIHKVATKSKIPSDEGEREAGHFYEPMTHRVRFPIESTLREILPILLNITKSIDSLYTTESKASIPSDLQVRNFEDENRSDAVVQQVFTPERSSMKELLTQYHLPQQEEMPAECKRLHTLLTELRTFCYRLINFSMIMLPEFYQIPPQVLYESLFKSLPQCDAFQIRSFFRRLHSASNLELTIARRANCASLFPSLPLAANIGFLATFKQFLGVYEHSPDC